MQIDQALTQHLANLSRLHFSDDELLRMQADLQKMISFVEKLNELDTTGVEPLRHMSTVMDVYRADEPAVPMEVNRALENAAKYSDNFFTVPKVLS